MKKLILTISIIFLLVSVLYTNTLATEIIIGNTPSSNTSVNNSANNTNANTNSNSNTSNNTNKTNTTNKINTTSNKTTTNSSYKNTNLPDTGSEDFMIGFVIVAGLISAVYAYIKIKTYNI